MTFSDAIEFVLGIEGLRSNDPQDPGGLTRWGISSRQYPQVKDPNFSRADAIAIYRRDFWNFCHCGELPAPLALLIFDTAVNQGPCTAIHWLQQALSVKADGVIGTITLRAAQAASTDVLDSVLTSRALSYAADVAFFHDGRGWMKRLFKVQRQMGLVK